MCHVLSEGSKWSGLGRPCGLFPCAPRYHLSTDGCLMVSNLSLLLCVVCHAPACPCLCALAVVLCLCALPSAIVPVWCVCAWLWCVICTISSDCDCVPQGCSACATPCIFRPYTHAYNGHKNTPTHGLLFILCRGMDFLAYYFIFANTEHTFVYVSADIFPCL